MVRETMEGRIYGKGMFESGVEQRWSDAWWKSGGPRNAKVHSHSTFSPEDQLSLVFFFIKWPSVKKLIYFGSPHSHSNYIACGFLAMVVLANIYSDHLKSYYVLLLTRKRGNCECIATWGCPTPRLSFFALITTPCQVWSRWTYPLPYYSVLLLIYCFTLWPWPLTLNICSVSPAS